MISVSKGGDSSSTMDNETPEISFRKRCSSEAAFFSLSVASAESTMR